MSNEIRNRSTPDKASFDDLYNRPHPRRYFTALRPLEYSVPDAAQAVIRRCVRALRRDRRKTDIHILDLCAGYGLNGALAKFDLTLDDLYDYYGRDVPVPDMAHRLQADRDHFTALGRVKDAPRVTGQDVASQALDYAHRVGFVDAAIRANLERRALRPAEAKQVADVDLVTVTGGLSYIGAATFRHVLEACETPPWILYFPLRHTENHGVNGALAELGLTVEQAATPVPQRRYKDLRERHAALTRLEAMDPPGNTPPSTTHLEALPCLARPGHEAAKTPLAALTGEGDGKTPGKASAASSVLLGK